MTNYESASSASFALPSRCGSVVLQQQQQSQSCTLGLSPPRLYCPDLSALSSAVQHSSIMRAPSGVREHRVKW
ncbi:hypothetical protein NQZ68_034274 [Dissostichus eleginoides]|nr:hypothetical protein NQZ68_034274 [Dissostichus eleginoides]